MASMNVNRYNDPGWGTPAPNPIQNAYDTASGATRQQAGDYDQIMGGYRDLLSKFGNLGNQIRSAVNTPNRATTLGPYEETGDFRNSINNLGGLAANGGYSDQNLSDIRERALSPIRSVYGNAQRDLQRQKSLQGGYSPNYAAVSAKMSREMASQLADQTTAVNAQLAQNVAQNRLAASTPYASISAGDQADRNAYNIKRAELAHANGTDPSGIVSSFTMPLQGIGSALSGMTNLYGTTPAFAQFASNNANQQAQTQGQIQANNQNNDWRIGSLLR